MTAPKPAPAADPQQSASSAQGEEELDCGDNSCYFAKNKTGMRTNGGCRCFDKAGLRTRSTIAAAIEMLPKYLAMQAQITQLRAELEEARNDYEQRFEYEVHRQGDSLRSDLALAREALEWIANPMAYAANDVSGEMRFATGKDKQQHAQECLAQLREARLTTKEGKK